MAGVLGLGEVEWHSYHMNMSRQRDGFEIGKPLKKPQPEQKLVDKPLEGKEENILNDDQSQSPLNN